MLLELIWGIQSHVACHRLRHTLASVRHATPTLSLPSMGRGWVQIPLLLLEKCQTLWLPCREEEEGGRKEGEIVGGSKGNRGEEWARE